MISIECNGIIITLQRSRYEQLLWHFMLKRRYPHRIVPHRIRRFPRFINNRTRVYIISESFLRGFCFVERPNRGSNLLYFDRWHNFSTPLHWWGFGGYADSRYYHWYSRCLNPECNHPEPRHCSAVWDSEGNGPFCRHCLIEFIAFR